MWLEVSGFMVMGLVSGWSLANHSNSQLIGVISQYRPGDKVTVKIQRKGDILVKEVTLKNLEGTEEMHKDSDSFYNEVLGIKAQASQHMCLLGQFISEC